MKWAIVIAVIFILLGLVAELSKDKIDRRAALHIDPYNPQNYHWTFVKEEK